MNDQEKERTGANVISTMPITLLFWSAGGMGQWVQIIPLKLSTVEAIFLEALEKSFGGVCAGHYGNLKPWRILCKRVELFDVLKDTYLNFGFLWMAVESSCKENKLKLLTKLISLVVQEILLDASRNCIHP
jgi:hypothetical protein